MYRTITSLCIILLYSYGGFTQNPEIKINASFLEDSAKIGMPLGFSISAEYDEGIDLLFPDSSFNFQPLEFHSKTWFPTRTVDGRSKDSIVYYLKTFEIDSTQAFSLRYYQLINGDSLSYISPTDSFHLIHTVRSSPDSLGAIFLQEDTQYYRIPKKFNYPYLIAGLVISFLLLVILWLGFGKRIKRSIDIRRMKKANEKFLSKYGMLLHGLNDEKLPVLSENILIHWKKYMEQLDPLPYRKLTTKELAELNLEKEVVESLREIDQAIYSKAEMEKVRNNLEYLQDVSQRKYLEKLEEMQHGTSD